jgi:MFS transporter, MHS family, proline/betaine transporter
MRTIRSILLGSTTGALLSAILPPQSMDAWGWRIPFLLGLVVGVAGFFLRRHLDEGAVPQADGRSPLGETVRNHGRLLVRLAGLSVFNDVGFYLLFVYIVSWLQLADGNAPEINSLSMLLLPCMVAMACCRTGCGASRCCSWSRRCRPRCAARPSRSATTSP